MPTEQLTVRRVLEWIGMFKSPTVFLDMKISDLFFYGLDSNYSLGLQIGCKIHEIDTTS